MSTIKTVTNRTTALLIGVQVGEVALYWILKNIGCGRDSVDVLRDETVLMEVCLDTVDECWMRGWYLGRYRNTAAKAAVKFITLLVETVGVQKLLESYTP